MALPLIGRGGLNDRITSLFLLANETDWNLTHGKKIGDPDVDWTLAKNKGKEDETDWTLAIECRRRLRNIL